MKDEDETIDSKVAVHVHNVSPRSDSTNADIESIGEVSSDELPDSHSETYSRSENNPQPETPSRFVRLKSDGSPKPILRSGSSPQLRSTSSAGRSSSDPGPKPTLKFSPIVNQRSISDPITPPLSPTMGQKSPTLPRSSTPRAHSKTLPRSPKSNRVRYAKDGPYSKSPENSQLAVMALTNLAARNYKHRDRAKRKKRGSRLGQIAEDISESEFSSGEFSSDASAQSSPALTRDNSFDDDDTTSTVLSDCTGANINMSFDVEALDLQDDDDVFSESVDKSSKNETV